MKLVLALICLGIVCSTQPTNASQNGPHHAAAMQSTIEWQHEQECRRKQEDRERLRDSVQTMVIQIKNTGVFIHGGIYEEEVLASIFSPLADAIRRLSEGCSDR